MTEPLVLEPGVELAGKYRLLRLLGHGGMGLVFEAHHLELGHSVAVKVVRPEAALSAEAVARFLHEARACAKLKSEHVARVIDVGRLPDGLPYMVMEYLEGEDLGQALHRGPLSIQEAVDFTIQTCEAMAGAHARGIVHRDLKPANLFRTMSSLGAPCIKVLDFGISKQLTEEARQGPVTATSAFVGSPSYMSPEQMRSARDVDARTDIWAIGVVLFELLTTRLPFQAESVPEQIAAVMAAPPMRLRTCRPDAPPGLEAVISRCLEKEPAARYANVVELASALSDFASAEGRRLCEQLSYARRSSSIPPPASLPPASASVPATPPALQATVFGVSRSKRRARSARRFTTLAASLLGLGVAALALAFAWRARGGAETSIELGASAPASVSALASPTEPPTAVPTASLEARPEPPPSATPDVPLSSASVAASTPPSAMPLPTRPDARVIARPIPAPAPAASAPAAALDATLPRETVPANPLDIQLKE